MVHNPSMEIAVADAKPIFSELLRRANAGEEVVVTRHGRPYALITPVDAPSQRRNREERLAALTAISAEGGRIREKYGLSGRQLQDDLYDENGWPV